MKNSIVSRLISAVVYIILQINSLNDAKPRGKMEMMPDSCKEKTYCVTKHEHYPDETIQTLLENIEELVVMTESTNLTSNSATDFQESCDCETNIFMQPIYEIIDEYDNLRFVAQSANFRQVARIEECQ
ncbi:hypothetical protein O3G_MSEX004099 [Manduca sexta]|nr:hypothetical protein O3G_MSEX004099 [Manduca sexta]